MQIRKCVLLEMFSFVLIGMFSPFFQIIGSRIGTCLFRKVPSIFGGDTISENPRSRTKKNHVNVMST